MRAAGSNAPREIHDSNDLLPVERLGDKVIAAAVQHFSPQSVVREGGNNDERRDEFLLGHVAEEIPPVPVLEVALTD